MLPPATCYLLHATCHIDVRHPHLLPLALCLTYRCYFLPPTAIPSSRRHHILALNPPHLPYHHHLHWFLPCQSHSKGERSGGGADPTSTRKLLPDTILQAAKDGDVAAVQAWLDIKGHIDARESTAQGTLLMAAGVFGQVQLVQLLLGRGASIDLQNNDGLTALICATVNGNHSIVSVLLRAGASADLHAINGKTALEVADRLTRNPSIPKEQRQGLAEAARLLRQHAAAQTTQKAATTPKGAALKSVAAGGASGGQRTAGSGSEGTGDSDRRDGGSGAAQASLGSFCSPTPPLSTTHLLCSDWPAASYLLLATCYLLHATTCYLLLATLLPAACHLLPATCHLLPATPASCHLLCSLATTCYMLPATCYLRCATCYLPPATTCYLLYVLHATCHIDVRHPHLLPLALFSHTAATSCHLLPYLPAAVTTSLL